MASRRNEEPLDGSMDVSLGDIIDAHGDSRCEDDQCIVCAAMQFVAEARKTDRPWNEVRDLHAYQSVLHGRVEQLEQQNSRLAMLLMYLTNKLGGVVFVPKLEDLRDLPETKGTLSEEIAPGNDGTFLKITPLASSPQSEVS